MTEQDQIKALAELDGWVDTAQNGYVEHLAYRWNLVGTTIYKPEPPPYLTSYDAIIPLIQKQSEDMVEIVHYELLRLLATHYLILLATPAQLCEALLRATGKWKE